MKAAQRQLGGHQKPSIHAGLRLNNSNLQATSAPALKPHIYKRGNHWYCRRFRTLDGTGWGGTASDAYLHWFQQNIKLEVSRGALERQLAEAMLADAGRHV